MLESVHTIGIPFYGTYLGCMHFNGKNCLNPLNLEIRNYIRYKYNNGNVNYSLT